MGRTTQDADCPIAKGAANAKTSESKDIFPYYHRRLQSTPVHRRNAGKVRVGSGAGCTAYSTSPVETQPVVIWFNLKGESPPGINRGTFVGRGPKGTDVRFGSLADICSAKRHVRFTPESGHSRHERNVR